MFGRSSSGGFFQPVSSANQGLEYPRHTALVGAMILGGNALQVNSPPVSSTAAFPWDERSFLVTDRPSLLRSLDVLPAEVSSKVVFLEDLLGAVIKGSMALKSNYGEMR